MKPKTWLICFFAAVTGLLVLAGGIIIYFDPFFHYHAPLKEYFYNIDNERYQNDGIMRHFDYDNVLTGTSMSENFKTSDFESLFGGKAVKVPYSGGSFCEISTGIERALCTHKVNVVVRSLDYTFLITDKDYIDPKYDAEYLTDELIFNDLKYLINKDVLLKYCYPMNVMRKEGVEGGHTSFDVYANWMDEFEPGESPEWKNDIVKGEEEGLSEQQKIQIRENITQNIVDQAERYADTDFYLFFPPYSIANWQMLYEKGKITERLQAEEETVKLLMDCQNIKLFSFNDEKGLITDLTNYSDSQHYLEGINTKMLTWMKNGEHLINKDNYREYLDWEKDFFLNYDYDN